MGLLDKKKPVVRKRFTKDCEVCKYKSGEFFHDKIDPNVIRVYCKARHVEVNAEEMSGGNCDFFAMDGSGEKSKEEVNPYGL